MIIWAQYLDSKLVPPPHRNSSQVPPQDRKKPCIFNLTVKRPFFHYVPHFLPYDYMATGELIFDDVDVGQWQNQLIPGIWASIIVPCYHQIG